MRKAKLSSLIGFSQLLVSFVSFNAQATSNETYYPPIQVSKKRCAVSSTTKMLIRIM